MPSPEMVAAATSDPCRAVFSEMSPDLGAAALSRSEEWGSPAVLRIRVDFNQAASRRCLRQ